MIQPKTFNSELEAPSQESSVQLAEKLWEKVPMAGDDPILGINEAFEKDTHKKKVNLGVATYRDENGEPVHLECVKQAEKKLFQAGPDHEYAPICGVEGFVEAAVELAYGNNSTPIKEGRWTALQVLGGTGALRLGFAFIKKFLGDRTVYMTKEAWPTHKTIIEDCLLQWKELTYYNSETKGLHFERYLEDLDKAPEGSVIIFQACGHNPTGIDPTKEQWHKILEVVLKKKHFTFFDMAYQGLATGDFDEDAYAVRAFAEKTPIFLAQTFSKNLGLAGERLGCFSATTSEPDEAKRINSQLKWLSRTLWSDPPLFGARIADYVLNNPELKKLWIKEVKHMVNRIKSMREALVSTLKDLGSKHNWEYIRDHIGMFAYIVRTDYHIYITDYGRFLIPGLNDNNLRYVAECIHEVTKDSDI